MDGPRAARPAASGRVVVRTAGVAPPRHKPNPGTGRERAKRAKAQAEHRAHKQGRKTQPPSAIAQRYAKTWCSSPPRRPSTKPSRSMRSACPSQRSAATGIDWGVRVAVVELRRKRWATGSCGRCDR